MPRQHINPGNVEEAVQQITPYLEDTSDSAPKAIYWNGWYGLGASAVLRAIAQDPPRSLREKFGRIIHIDCSRWKSRRALQRAIAEEIKLPQRVMSVLDRQDEDDDFNGVDEGSRVEIADVGREILRALQEYRCLVVFHNGSNDMVDLIDLGIPQPLLGTKVLWTFRGRLRLNPGLKEKVDGSHLCLYSYYSDYLPGSDALLREEAREIAEELKLPQGVMAVFDRKDEEDDFSGVDEGSKAEIANVGIEINRALRGVKCMVVFHNGSNSTIDLNDFGISQYYDKWSGIGCMLLWTFRGRLRLNPELKEKVDDSHLFLYSGIPYPPHTNAFFQEEAREIARYTSKPGVTPKVAAQCCSYLLALNSKGGDIMDYNWAMHASNYWVCDGIIQGGQDNNEEAWDAATALHQELRLEDYSSNMLPSFGSRLHTPPNRWIFLVNVPTVPPESTSFFLAVDIGSDPPLASLPDDMFHQSDKLRVLKLCRCTFSFTWPPFHCCRSLKFLGLDSCKDQPREQDEKQQRPTMEFFQSLWVLDICYTDWELALSPEIIEQMATNIREVHIKKGKIWRSNHAWRRLRKLRKLRVIEPTCPWETGDMDEFTDMGKLELLDLSRNSTMQVLPSLSGATGLKTLVLDGCVGLDHVGPEGLPPFLESFSLDAGEDHNKAAKISRISLFGCARLVNFILRGSLPNLELLDLSSTSVKTLDLKYQVVKVTCLQQMILLGCEKLRSILWPLLGLPQLRVLCIDSPVCRVQTEHCQAYAAITDVRFIQSLVLRSRAKFCWNDDKFCLNMCGPSTSKDDGQSCHKEKMGPNITGQIIGLPPGNLLIPYTYRIYADVTIDNITSDHDDRNAHMQFQPLDSHLEIGEGFSYTKNVESMQCIKAIIFVMNKVESLHMHDNASITTVIPERMMSIVEWEQIGWDHLKRCRVERCPRLHTVFPTDFYYYKCFAKLETFLVANLLMAHCIWGKGRTIYHMNNTSFATLRSIHLYSCPRLIFVLSLSWRPILNGPYFPNLETLHIVYCGELRQVFPVDLVYRKGILEFPKLKHIHLHELPKLQQICEAKMYAPMLEKIRVRGCWSLRRLPAIDRDSRPIVDCKKDWWGKLEWDGLHVGHDPSLFDLRPSQYYKKPLPRGSVLR